MSINVDPDKTGTSKNYQEHKTLNKETHSYQNLTSELKRQIPVQEMIEEFVKIYNDKGGAKNFGMGLLKLAKWMKR